MNLKILALLVVLQTLNPRREGSGQKLLNSFQSLIFNYKRKLSYQTDLVVKIMKLSKTNRKWVWTHKKFKILNRLLKAQMLQASPHFQNARAKFRIHLLVPIR